MAAHAPTTGRAEKTRQAILDAAEQLFAERGFAATRLEDIAQQVGIRRASMVYHFKDKRELHTAVLSSVLEGLGDEIRDAVSLRKLDPQQRIEAAVGAWVDYVGSRPATARILLRELANAGRELPTELLVASRPLALFIREHFVDDESMRQVVLSSSATPIDRMQMASIVAGSTLFFVAATPVISQEPGFDPQDAAQMSAHKEQLLGVVRLLLRFDES